ncbi:apolipoprotein L6-like [Varanus komodoensis]|uniref:apolipoprotein L6-like n=1 Tax=Varanus komodoensis TaxID=61221 RepID=UPI001CF7D114|nr:apolipoprotein L6-like [Varanus komodoensis]
MELSWLLSLLILLLLLVNLVLIYLLIWGTPRLTSGRSARNERAAETSTSRGELALIAEEKATGAEHDAEKKRTKKEQVGVNCTIFLDTFPAKKEIIQQCISSLREMADCIDETHKNCAIATVAVNITSTSSEILKMVSQFLAPSSATGSLHTAIAGISLEMVAKITDVSTALFKSDYDSKKKKNVEDKMKEVDMALRTLMNSDEIQFNSELPIARGENLNSALALPDLLQAGEGFKTNISALNKHIKALNCIRRNPELKDLAMKVAAGDSSENADNKEVEKFEENFAGTPLGLTKDDKLKNAAWSICVLMGTIKNTVDSVTQMREGIKAEMAVNIRSKANQLDKILQNLERFYEEMKAEDHSVKLKST